MNEALLYLAFIGIILFFGILCTIVSKGLKIPNVLLLIIFGLILGKVRYQGDYLVRFPEVFIVSIGVLALVMIVFDSTSRLKLKEFNVGSMPAIELTVVFLVLLMIFMTGFTFYLYNVSLSIAFLFSAIMAGTAPDVVMFMMTDIKHKTVQLLEVESILNTPIVVLIPFLIIEFVSTGISKSTFTTQFLDQILPFLQQIVVGIGAGILIGIIIFKIMRKQYSEYISPLALIVAALLTYVLAEALKGSGVLAVTTLGLFFGSIYVRQKSEMQEFSSFFSYALEILVFAIIGLIIKVPFTLKFFGLSLTLFLIMVIIRYFAVTIVFKKSFNLKERLFMTLNAPKGIAIASVVFMLTTYITRLPEIARITDLILIFILYSIILSSVVAKFSLFFIHKEIIK